MHHEKLSLDQLKWKFAIAYIVFASWIPTLNALLNFGNMQATIDSHNWELAWGLLFCIPLLLVIGGVLDRFRKMPLFALLVAPLAGWNIWIALSTYMRYGFDSRSEIDMQPFHLLPALMVLAVPFALLYRLVHWVRNRNEEEAI